MSIERINYKNLGQEVFETLKNKIIRWELKPGQRLIDRDLAEGLGVSRSLVRNAIGLLEKEGLVNVVSRSGVYVKKFTQKDIDDIFEVRKLLELFALESAFGNITGDDLNHIAEKIGLTREGFDQGQYEASYDLDVALHQLVIDRGHNSEIKKIYANYRSIIGIIIFSDYFKVNFVKDSFVEHCQIFEAIKADRKQHTAGLLMTHLDRSKERVIEMFESRIVETA